MTAFFPELRPDELLYSGLARYGASLRYASGRNVSSDVFGRPTAGPVVNLPSGIDAVLLHLPRGHSYTAAQLIDEHTLLPYYAAWLPAERCALVREAMRSASGATPHRLLGLQRSTVHAHASMMHCELCAASDRARFGDAYWRRAHQLPGVWLCPVHESPLQSTRVERGSARGSRPNYVTLESALQAGPAEPMIVPEFLRQHLLALAAGSAWLLDSWQRPRWAHLIAERYRACFADGGWLHPSGRVRQTELRDALAGWYGDDLISVLGCELGPRESAWVDRICRNDPWYPPPLYHLLLVRFLGVGLEGFASTVPTPAEGVVPFRGRKVAERSCRLCDPEGESAWRSPVDGEPDAVRCPSCGFAWTGSPDAKYVVVVGPRWRDEIEAHAADAHLTLPQAARKLRLSRKVLRHLLDRLGITRPDWKSTPATAVRKSTAAEKRERYRAAWLAERDAAPDRSVVELKRHVGAAYNYLWTHDRDWLVLNSPTPNQHRYPGPFVDWAARDAGYLRDCRRVVSSLRRAPGRPVRISRWRITQQLGIVSKIAAHEERLPLTLAYLRKIEESRTDHEVRRIKWACEDLKGGGVALTSSRVRRRANLPRPRFPIHEAYIAELVAPK